MQLYRTFLYFLTHSLKNKKIKRVSCNAGEVLYRVNVILCSNHDSLYSLVTVYVTMTSFPPSLEPDGQLIAENRPIRLRPVFD